jgi:F-type H+-transporting ATPase subunit epsilon
LADTVEFELVSPERLVLSAPVEMVVVPGAEGDFGVLPGHAPIISTVRTGVIATYESGAVTRRIFVAGGFAEVSDDRCTVLAEQAVALDDVDRAEAEERVRAARKAVDDALDDDATAAAEARLAIAEGLLKAVEEAGAAA